MKFIIIYTNYYCYGNVLYVSIWHPGLKDSMSVIKRSGNVKEFSCGITLQPRFNVF